MHETFRRLLTTDLSVATTPELYGLVASASPIQTEQAATAIDKDHLKSLVASNAGVSDVELCQVLRNRRSDRYAQEEFPPGLPFDALVFADDEDLPDVPGRFALTDLLGMTARQFIGSATGTTKRSFSRLRKLIKQHDKPPIPEDIMTLCIGAGVHSKRRELLFDFLHGKAAPVLEFLLIDHWRKITGTPLPEPEQVSLTGDMLIDDVLPERILTCRQYQEMLGPILSDLQQLPRVRQLDPDDRTWALFNAWWAIASLYGDIVILQDSAPLWPEAAEVLAHSARTLYTVDLDLSPLCGEAIVPLSGFDALERIARFGRASATIHSLLREWRRLEGEVPILLDDFDTLARADSERDTTILHQHRKIIVGIYDRYSRVAEISLFDRLASHSEAHVGPDKSCASVRQLKKMATHMEGVRNIMSDQPEGHTDITILWSDNKPAGEQTMNAMAGWLHSTNDLCNEIERAVEGWNVELIKAANIEGTITKRMTAIQQASEKFANWQSETASLLNNQIERGLAQPWLNVVATIPSGQVANDQVADRKDAGPAENDREKDSEDDAPADYQALKGEVDRYKNMVNHYRHKVSALRAQLNRTKDTQRNNAQTNSRGALITALKEFSENNSCPHALRLVESAHPERVRMLPTALVSACDADSSLSASGLLRKVYALVSDGWEVLAADRPPYEMRSVLSCDLALSESDSTRNDTRCMQQRTFLEKHKDGSSTHWEMSWHLKLDQRHRLYFAWDPDTRQIVIGHAGAHLGLAAARS